MPDLAGAVAWLNSPPLNRESSPRQSCADRFLDVLLHQLPARAALCGRLAEKYKDAGLVVIGVHTPEFAFEKERATWKRRFAI